MRVEDLENDISKTERNSNAGKKIFSDNNK